MSEAKVLDIREHIARKNAEKTLKKMENLALDEGLTDAQYVEKNEELSREYVKYIHMLRDAGWGQPC